MDARAVLGGLTSELVCEAYADVSLPNLVHFIHDSTGTWRDVSDVLRPFYEASGATWWHASQGRYITDAKAKAVRTYLGINVVSRPGKRCGTSPFTPEHRRRKAAIGATWQEIIEAGLTALEDNQTQGVQAAK